MKTELIDMDSQTKLLLVEMDFQGSILTYYYYVLAELLARAKRARSGAPWVRKFGKLSIPENLVMAQRTPARPPTRTHSSCKQMSNVTIGLAQLDQPLSYVSHPYEDDQIDSCQNETSADNYHMTISRAQMKDQSFCPYI